VNTTGIVRLVTDIAKKESSLVVVENEPLAHHTSWRIGGPTRFYTEVSTVEDLYKAFQWGYERDLPLFLLGGGTNILVRDEGFAGLVIRYCAQKWYIEDQGDEGLLYVEAGTPIGKLTWVIGAQGWGNIQWAAGLPGSVGGAIYGNAGCYGGDIASILSRSWILVDGEPQEWTVDQMEYTYRSSILKVRAATKAHNEKTKRNPPVILASEFRLVRWDKMELMQMMKQIASQRKSKTPVGKSSGSVFKNPSGAMTAGRLIDQAGLKGTRIGGAEISQTHGNYIVNMGSASSDDVLRLIELTQQTVSRQFGIVLELEVQIVGNGKCRVQST